MKNIGFISYLNIRFLTTAFFVDVGYKLATQVFDKYFFNWQPSTKCPTLITKMTSMHLVQRN